MLDQPGVGFQLIRSQEQIVADAQLRAGLAGKESIVVPIAKVDHRIFGRTLGLAVEQVGNGCHSIKLEGLIGVKLQFHGNSLRASGGKVAQQFEFFEELPSVGW